MAELLTAHFIGIMLQKESFSSLGSMIILWLMFRRIGKTEKTMKKVSKDLGEFYCPLVGKRGYKNGEDSDNEKFPLW